MTTITIDALSLPQYDGADMIIGLIAVLMAFGLPAYLLKRRYDYKERLLENKGSDADLMLLKQGYILLQERIVELEATVRNADFELNSKLSKLELQSTKPAKALKNKD